MQVDLVPAECLFSLLSKMNSNGKGSDTSGKDCIDLTVLSNSIQGFLAQLQGASRGETGSRGQKPKQRLKQTENSEL